MRAKGVIVKNCEKEQELFLWEKNISFQEAIEITDWLCGQFDLEKVSIKFGKSEKLNGIYEPKIKRIVLYKKGFNLATLVHEVAHHYCFLVYKKGGHKKEFSQSHTLMLQKIEEYLVRY